MKQILTISLAAAALAAACALTSCNDNTKPKNQVLDPLAKISIKPAPMPQAVASKATYPTPLEVVQKTTDIVMISPNFPNEPWVNLGIADEQRDVTNLRIMLWGMWVINEGKVNTNFIGSHDMIFVTRDTLHPQQPITDTLGYIPNKDLREAEVKIKAAFAVEDYDEVYRLFDEAYRFTPINGADWFLLKIQGLN